MKIGSDVKSEKGNEKGCSITIDASGGRIEITLSNRDVKSITLKEGDAKLKIVLKDSLAGIIREIPIKAEFGENEVGPSEQQGENESTQENPGQNEQQQSGEPGQEVAKPKTPAKRRNTKNEENEKASILSQFASKAASYDEFIKEIVVWLGLGNAGQFFKDVVEVATQLDKISWRKIESAFANKGISFNQYYRTKCGKLITEKFEECGETMTIMTLINTIMSYKTYEFSPQTAGDTPPAEAEEVAEADADTPPTDVEEVTEAVADTPPADTEEVVEAGTDTPTADTEEVAEADADTPPVNTAKLEGVLTLPCFDEIMKCAERISTIEGKIKFILASMGLNEESDEKRKDILKIALVAVTTKGLSDANIQKKTEMSEEKFAIARMQFSEFVNSYIGMHHPDQKVQLLDFLQSLQSAVLPKSRETLLR